MSGINKQWIGIDVCKLNLDVAIHPQGLTFRVSNNTSGQAELVQRLSGYEVAGIVLEATGGLERSVMSTLESAGYQMHYSNLLMSSLNRLGEESKVLV